MAKGAALRFVVEDDANGRWLVLFAGASTTHFWRGSLDADEVRDVVDAVRRELEKVHRITGQYLEVMKDDSAEAVDRLLGFSLEFAETLFAGQCRGLYEQARCQAPTAFDPSADARIVEVTTPEKFLFPFELIRWQDAPEDLPKDPAIQVRALLGMSAIIQRRFTHDDATCEGSLLNDPKLRMTVFRNPALPGAQQEIDYFKKVEPLVTAEPPWPNETDELREEAAARHIIDSRIGVDGVQQAPVSVIHLACHCNTTDSSTRDHYINVGGAHGKVSLGKLRRHITMAEAAEVPIPRPLIFLNACGSAAQMPDRSSITKFLLKYRYIGVLGTLCDISDEVAAHFAIVFYESLFNGRSVGEAMHDARWHLMDRHRNPLGLLYTFYGNPDLKVAQPRIGKVIPACDKPPVWN